MFTLTTCGTASWRKISNVFASKRTFRGLRTYEGKITLHKTSLSLFEARVTYFRRLASVSPRKLWHPRTVWCDIVQYCTVWSAGVAKYSQVLPSPLTPLAAKCLVLPSTYTPTTTPHHHYQPKVWRVWNNARGTSWWHERWSESWLEGP